MPRTESLDWFKSSHSNNGGNCVEVSTGLTAVRDSKNPDGPVLHISPSSFAAFVAGVRAGGFGQFQVLE